MPTRPAQATFEQFEAYLLLEVYNKPKKEREMNNSDFRKRFLKFLGKESALKEFEDELLKTYQGEIRSSLKGKVAPRREDSQSVKGSALESKGREKNLIQHPYIKGDGIPAQPAEWIYDLARRAEVERDVAARAKLKEVYEQKLKLKYQPGFALAPKKKLENAYNYRSTPRPRPL